MKKKLAKWKGGKKWTKKDPVYPWSGKVHRLCALWSSEVTSDFFWSFTCQRPMVFPITVEVNIPPCGLWKYAHKALSNLVCIFFWTGL